MKWNSFVVAGHCTGTAPDVAVGANPAAVAVYVDSGLVVGAWGPR